MSNVLSDEKKQQVIALGKLGWSLRRIEEATGVRRETASAYLKTAGVAVCLPGWGRRAPAKPAIQVTPDSGAKPAIVTPDFIARFSQKRSAPSSPSPPSPSICEEYRKLIEEGLARGRNGKAIWQDLVADHGVRKPQASSSPHQEKRHRSTMAVVRWCAIRRPASTAGHDCLC